MACGPQEYLVVGRVVTIIEDPAAVAGAGGETPGNIQELLGLGRCQKVGAV
jgi:hypothetical protein